MSYNNYNISIYYGAGLLGYWVGIFVIAILANLFRKMFPRLTNYCTGAVSNAFRKYILLPATFGKRRHNHFHLVLVDSSMVLSLLD